MSRTKCVVCLLALAGGTIASLCFSLHNSVRKLAPDLVARRLAAGRARRNISVPAMLEANEGQFPADVDFVGHEKGLSVELNGDGIAFAATNEAATNETIQMRLVREAEPPTKWKKVPQNGTSKHSGGLKKGQHESGWHKRQHPKDWKNLRNQTPSAKGKKRKSSWHGTEDSRARANYFLGNDPRKWRTNVPLYAAAEATVADGVTMLVYGTAEGFEYDLRAAPRTNASDLRLKFSANATVRMNADGDLLVTSRHGSQVRMRKPRIYTESTGQDAPVRTEVTGGYELEADGTVRFAIGPHDPQATLVIDPSLSVTYSTFLGGAGSETASSMGMDAAGNIYVGGTTTNPASFSEPTAAAFGPLFGANPPNGTSTVYFVAKINPNVSGPSSLVYLTFIGGSVTQTGGLIAVDSGGDVAIAGATTSPDFPVTDGTALTSGANDLSVSEIDPTGSALTFSTLFGGSGAESQYASGGIALDASGNIYIASDTSSTDLHITAGAFQPVFQGQVSDGFLAEFQPSASPSLIYCSYLGANSTGQVGVGGVAIDAANNVYIAGFTSNAVNGFPVKNAFQTQYGGNPSDAFLMKIFPGGQGAADLIYATLLGGNGLDQALAVAVDNSIPANAYVTGTTRSTNFPTNGTTAAFQPSLHTNATANAFLTVIAQNPSTGAATLAYSTYLGGSSNDTGFALAVTAFNSVYVAGTANSWDFPWRNNVQPFNGLADAFVAKFDPSSTGAASLVYATPLGGTAPAGASVSASGTSIAANPFGAVYVAGQTNAADFPMAVTSGGFSNGFQTICASCQNFPSATDAFLVAWNESTLARPSVYFNSRNVIFPAAPVGTQNVPQPVALHNGGQAPLSISNLQITGPNAADFSLIGPGACSGASIPVGGQCSFEVGFTPSTTGPEAAVVSVTDNAPGNPQVLELVGAGQGPLVSLSATTLNFGSLPENTSSVRELTVTNVGNQALTIQSQTESGTDVAQFFISGSDDSCGPSLPGATSCIIGVVFAPKAIGTFHAQISLTDNSGGVSNATQTIALVGAGTTPSAVASVSPASLAFGGIQVGTSSGTQQVTLLNTGSIALNLSSISLSGANASDFVVSGSGAGLCALGSSNVAVGASCSVSVRFAPAVSDSLGTKSATLLFADNATGSPQMVALSGTATGPASIQISPASLHFAPQSSGTSSTPQAVTVTNAGASALSINGFGMTGANTSDYKQTNNCPPSLNNGGACVVNVVFAPTFQSASTRSASLSISDNAAGSPQTVALSGTATQASIQISPASINFSGQQAGTASAPQTITVTNTGAGNLSFTSIAMSSAADFVIDTNTCSGAQTPPGGNCAIQLSFSPACTNGVAARSANLLLTDNVPGSSQSVLVNGIATGDFCFAAVGSATVIAGQTATYTVVANSATGYRGSVSLTCANFPSASACTVPPSVTVPSQFAVSVTTAANSRVAPFSQRRWLTPPASMVLTFIAMIFLACGVSLMRWQQREWSVPLFLVVAIAAALCIAACGGGGSVTPSSAAISGTPTGKYMLTVIGTSTNTTGSVNLSLTVQ